MLEIDQVFVVLEDPDVGEGAPGVLNLLSGDLILRLLSDLATLFLESSPSPLYLDRCDVVHGKPVILEQSSRQRHLVRGLNQSCAEVFHRLVFGLAHVVEGRGYELLTEALRGREVLHGGKLRSVCRVLRRGLLLGLSGLLD